MYVFIKKKGPYLYLVLNIIVKQGQILHIGYSQLILRFKLFFGGQKFKILQSLG